MPAEKPDRPFVNTTIARHLITRISVTHQERAISVFSGPWGIGKTTAIDAFAAGHYPGCAVVKVEPASRKSGQSPVGVMQQTIESLRDIEDFNYREVSSTAHWVLRREIFRILAGIAEYHHSWSFRIESIDQQNEPPLFTLIFDEAQHLSMAAIEMLRYWNDRDRTSTPWPIGLVFVGNEEFALEDTGRGQSVLSGAVQSRALFVERLKYESLTEADLTLFLQSRGMTDAAAIGETIGWLRRVGAPRDLRKLDHYVDIFRRRSAGDAITAELVRSVFSPA